jgi:hypothetical protein
MTKGQSDVTTGVTNWPGGTTIRAMDIRPGEYECLLMAPDKSDVTTGGDTGW